jgi:UPF0716 protein FxsA
VCGVLALLFIAVPALEIYVIIQVGGLVGPLATVGIIFATGIAGAALAKHQGFAAVRRMQEAMASGREIGRSMAEAALVLVAAVLMVTPGFLTDGVGIALLIPPIRALVAARLVIWGQQRVAHQTVVIGGFPQQPEVGDDEAGADQDRHDPPPPGVIDV